MDKKGLFSIGEVSKLFHISGSSLRHYENIALLAPAYISPDSGYRYYGTEQFEALNTIRYLRALSGWRIRSKSKARRIWKRRFASWINPARRRSFFWARLAWAFRRSIYE